MGTILLLSVMSGLVTAAWYRPVCIPLCLHPRRHPVPYIVYCFWLGPVGGHIGLWSKVHYRGNREPLGIQPLPSTGRLYYLTFSLYPPRLGSNLTALCGPVASTCVLHLNSQVISEHISICNDNLCSCLLLLFLIPLQFLKWLIFCTLLWSILHEFSCSLSWWCPVIELEWISKMK